MLTETSLNTLLSNTLSIEKRLKFVEEMESHAPVQDKGEAVAWATEQYANALVGVDQTRNGLYLSISDIVMIGRKRGAGFLGQMYVNVNTQRPILIRI